MSKKAYNSDMSKRTLIVDFMYLWNRVYAIRGNETPKLVRATLKSMENSMYYDDKYIVLVPLADSYPVSADNLPIADVQELRITIFSKENYIKLKNQIISILLSNDFCITERKYNGYDADTGYYQYTIDVAKNYEIEEDIY